MTANAAAAPTRVPILLPHLRIELDGGDHLVATLDRAAYDVPAEWARLGRAAVPRLVTRVVEQLDAPIRVEVTDEGATFTDIVTPSGPDEAAPPTSHGPPTLLKNDVSGGGFSPGESVAIAVVVAHQVADEAGTARVRLPPAVLASQPTVVLLGTDSGAITTNGVTA